MTTTPVVWKPSFIVNAGYTAGKQTVPQTIGLSNGNILVVWEDTSDINGPSTGIDVVARIFDPEGKPIAAPFQLNTAIVASDETGPKIVALPDGGFVMAYGSYLEAIGGFIEIQRYDANGTAMFSTSIIVREPTAWEITADAAGNYTVSFELEIPFPDFSGRYSIDIHSFTYNFTNNARGLEQTEVAQNSTEPDRLAATDAFANGHVITFYTEPDFLLVDGTDYTAEFRIYDPVTGAIIRDIEIDEGASLDGDHTALDVAVLMGGQFVVLYHETYDGYAFRVGNTETSALGPQVELPDAPDPNTVSYNRGAHVVALQDGGFFVAWLEAAGAVYGQRYGAYGDLIGARVLIAEDVLSFAPSRLSLASDGRILVPYRNTGGEIAEVILDTRDNIIFGTSAGEVITTQLTSTQIFGLGGSDTILGQGGNDSIYGGADFDTLRGGKGSDTYYLYDATLNGDFDVVVEAAGGGVDTVHVRADGLDPNILYSYSLTENVENGIVDGMAGLDLIGNTRANQLTGNSSTNFFFGLGGNDHLNGGGGADWLYGGEGNDTYVLDDTTGLPGFESYDTVAESSASGLDTVRVNSSTSNPGSYTLTDNVENGTITGTASFDLRGNDLNNKLIGNSAANSLTGLGGNDVVQGGGGADTLFGGTGQDRFVFTALTDSGIGKGLRDVIRNFTTGDVIDVRQIDANSTLAGNQAFVMDTDGVSSAGEISFKISGAYLMVTFQTDAEVAAEMQILLTNRTSIIASDFIL